MYKKTTSPVTLARNRYDVVLAMVATRDQPASFGLSQATCQYALSPILDGGGQLRREVVSLPPNVWKDPQRSAISRMRQNLSFGSVLLVAECRM